MPKVNKSRAHGVTRTDCWPVADIAGTPAAVVASPSEQTWAAVVASPPEQTWAAAFAS